MPSKKGIDEWRRRVVLSIDQSIHRVPLPVDLPRAKFWITALGL